MKTETKILGAILIGTLVLLVGGIFLLSRGNSAPAEIEGASVSQIDYTKGQKIGSDSAKVKLVEFSDFQCPACKTAEPVIKNVLLTYSDKVQFIYRHFPLPQHAFGKQTAVYAEAAGEQGKFWEMHDKIFETQAEWSGLNDNDATAFFLGLTKQLGLNENRIKQAVATDSLKARIDVDTAEGNRLGVNSTPTFFINGRKVNLQSFDDLNTAVAQELKK
ncbi:MAG: thioredoxin domain-containing protein [Candidatus Daviesbacteria bacterium]|nr:thioredoxin domain-containing protein [Candidatus Daviesbacteria bacterium]